MITLRKAFSVSIGLLLVGLLGCLLYWIAGSVYLSIGHWAGPFKIMQDTFQGAMSMAVAASLPGLLGLFISSCWYLLSAFKAPVQEAQ